MEVYFNQKSFYLTLLQKITNSLNLCQFTSLILCTFIESVYLDFFVVLKKFICSAVDRRKWVFAVKQLQLLNLWY